MQHSRHGLRIALHAGASVVALAVAAPSAGAADLNKPLPMKAPPALPVAKDTWTWWIEGGPCVRGEFVQVSREPSCPRLSRASTS
jgi:hypothetical protein